MQVCQLLGAVLLGSGGHTHRADLAGGRGSWAGIPTRLEGEPHSDTPGLGSGVWTVRGARAPGSGGPQQQLLCFAPDTKNPKEARHLPT